MRERAWKYWKRALAVLVAMILIFEALPLSALAAAGRDNYIPLVSSEDEEEDEDYTEDAELLDDRPLLAAGISPRAFRASGSNATISNALPLATPYVAFRQASGGYTPWTGAVEDGTITPGNNYLKLDPANAVFHTPSDFVIGKYNSRTFSVQFAFRPSEISDTVRNNLVMELWIPAGLDLSGTPSLTGVNFSSRRLADGSWVLTAKPDPTTASVSGQITLVQDPSRLIKDLPLSQGELPIRMRLINNYGSTNPAAPPTLYTLDSGDHDKTTALVFNTSASNPTMTFSNPSDSYTFMPGEVAGVVNVNAGSPAGTPVGRRMISMTDRETSATEDALASLGMGGWITYGFGGTNPNFPRKALEFKVHKTEGYLG